MEKESNESDNPEQNGYGVEDGDTPEPQDVYAPLVWSFSEALMHVKHGGYAARKGWNGKNMFIFLVPGSTFQVNRPPLLGIFPEGTEINYHGHIDLRAADGTIVPWLASQADMLAEDWLLYNPGGAPISENDLIAAPDPA